MLTAPDEEKHEAKARKEEQKAKRADENHTKTDKKHEITSEGKIQTSYDDEMRSGLKINRPW